MKKEYLILIALILILGAYLLFHKENKDNYVLPKIVQIDISKITGLIIDKKQGSIKFIKKEKNWLLTDKEYLADLPSVENMLDTLKTLKLSALVSQKGDLKRYELDDKKHIRVKVLEGAKTIFEFTMGKPAPTFNHTFVMLTDNKNIYHANGSFRSYFDRAEDNFRDKKVLDFKKESIKRFTIEKDGLSKTLISKKIKKDGKDAFSTWNSEDGTSADKEVISNLLSSVSFLECEKYLDSPTKKSYEKEKPLCKIRLENESGIELTLFETDKEDIFKGISSMNDYVFALSQFNGKEIVSNIEKLLGISKKEKNKD
ncbi:MAG: DUF4340 domain-containing protein [Desulfobacula sp.]|uniref:DUF4340 domain-containing protein n=1 Tax=Desulfobacula sp. TaxID=2593537 RepID=UPI0025BDB1E6|nr:DUF4340 domain-containing protein [Desulfobacula sp.]MCD4722747.1 DUF4340 domain-containing protein [Desulfobacula sp.]